MDLIDNKTNIKGFWSRPEGITGWIFLIAIAAAIFWGWGMIVPFIVGVMQNTLEFILLGVALAAVTYAILDDNFRAGMVFLFKMAMRKITGTIVQIDPIEIMRSYIRTLGKRKEEIYDAMSKLQGAIAKLSGTIEKNERDKADFLAKARAARVQGKSDQIVALNANSAGRIEDSNKQFKPILEQQKNLYGVLRKVYEAADFMIQDKTDEVDRVEQKYNTLKAGSSAINSAKKIFRGSAEGDLYKQAADFLEADMSNRIGEMDNFMTDIKSTLDNIDVENGMMTQKGLDLLEKVSTTDLTFLTNNDTSINAPQLIGVPKKNNNNSSDNSNTFSNLLD